MAFLRASGTLVGASVAAVPRDVGLALRDGGRKVGDAALALPRDVGRAAAESGRRVGEVGRLHMQKKEDATPVFLGFGVPCAYFIFCRRCRCRD